MIKKKIALLLSVTVLAIRVIITSIIGVFMIGIATEGYLYAKLNLLLRPVVFAGALLLITESVYQDFIGFAILVILIIYQKTKAKKDLDSKPKVA